MHKARNTDIQSALVIYTLSQSCSDIIPNLSLEDDAGCRDTSKLPVHPPNPKNLKMTR